MSELAGWDGFYSIVGSAAGTLVGLQFVAMSLVANRPAAHGEEAGAAFGTPTIVHFSVGLVLSAVLRAPWAGVGPAAICWGAIGACGMVYALVIARRMHAQRVYRPVLEDWVCHFALPLGAYLVLAGAAFTAGEHPRESLFAVAGASLLLLLVAIHNVWDAAVYHVYSSRVT